MAETLRDNPTGARSDMSGPWEQYQQEGPSEAPVASAAEEVRAPWDMYAEDSKKPAAPGVQGLAFEDNSADGEVTAGQMAGGLAMDTLKGTIHSIKWIPDAVEMVAPNPVTGKAKRIIDDSLEYADTLVSDSYRAMKNKEIVGKDEDGNMTLSAPSVGQAAGLVLETLPQIPQMLVGGGLIGKGLVKAGLSAKAAVPAGYGAMNSLMSTPESYHDTMKEALVEGRAKGLTGEELDNYATERANTAALIVAPLTAVTGAAGLGGAAKVGAGTEGLIKAVLKGVAADTPAEAVESYGQSAAGDIAMERAIDQAKALDQGAKGAIAGGVMGGATAAKHSIESKIRPSEAPPEVAPEADPTADASDLFDEETSTPSPDQPAAVPVAEAAPVAEVAQEGKVKDQVESRQLTEEEEMDALFQEEVDKDEMTDEEFAALKAAIDERLGRTPAAEATPATEQPVNSIPEQPAAPVTDIPAIDANTQAIDANPQPEAVVPADLPSIDESRPVRDTRGTGERFHGSSKPLPEDGPSNDGIYQGSEKNIYGDGFYTTDAADIAGGYTKKGNGGDPSLYSVKEKESVKLYDMNQQMSPNVRSMVERAMGDNMPTESDGKTDINTLAGVYDAFRANSASDGLSAHDVQAHFDSIKHNLESDGYRGFTHIGGEKTGKDAHSVNIYWKPKDDLNVTKGSLDDYRGEAKRNVDTTAPKGWDRNLVVARKYAKELGVNPWGKKLPELTVDIKAKLAENTKTKAAQAPAVKSETGQAVGPVLTSAKVAIPAVKVTEPAEAAKPVEAKASAQEKATEDKGHDPSKTYTIEQATGDRFVLAESKGDGFVVDYEKPGRPIKRFISPETATNYAENHDIKIDGGGATGGTVNTKTAVQEPPAQITAPKDWDKNLLTAQKYAKALGIEPGNMKIPALKDAINSQVASDEFDRKAHQAATSKLNDTAAPTQAQIEAGNYKKGHISVHGLNVSVENPRGSERSGIDGDGKAWSHEMSDHYGYFKGTEGADGDHVDTYVGKNPNADKVYIVDQIHQADGKFDEHKVMIGYDTKKAAVAAYRSNFDADWKVGKVVEMPVENFKTWLKEGDLKKPSFGSKAAIDSIDDSVKAKMDNKSSESRRNEAKRIESFEIAEDNTYKTEDIATSAMKSLGLSNSHRVVKSGDQFVIRPTDATIARYRRSDAEAKGDGIGKAKAIREAIKGDKALEAIHIVPSFESLPPEVQEKAKADGAEAGTKGIFHKNTTYVIANAHWNRDDAIMTAIHEEVGHRGIHAIFGSRLKRTMESIYSSVAKTPAGLARLDSIRKEYEGSLAGKSPEAQRAIIAEEYVAGIIEKGGRATAVQSFISGLRGALRYFIPSKVKWSNTDILALAERSRGWLVRNNKVPFQNAPENMTETARQAWRKSGDSYVKPTALDRFRSATDRGRLKLRAGIFDRYAALKELDEKKHGRDFLYTNITESSWVRARMAPAAAGVVEVLMNDSRVQWNDKEGVIDTRDDGSLGMGSVLSRLETGKELESFFRWIAGNRSEVLKKQGRENLFSDEQIVELKKLGTGKTESGKDRSALFREVYADLKPYMNDVTEIGVKSGTISKENEAMWRDEFYVNYARVYEKPEYSGRASEKGLTRTEAIQQLKGGDGHLNDLFSNMVSNINHIIENSLRNMASAQALKTAAELGIAREVTVEERDRDISTYIMREGKRVYYEVDDPFVFEAISTMEKSARKDGWLETATDVGSIFKAGFTHLTTITPQFIIGNTIKDAVSALATSPIGANPIGNTVQGMKVWADKKKRARMLVSGAAFYYGNNTNHDPAAVRKSVKNLVDMHNMDGISQAKTILKKAWDNSYGGLMNYSENGTRGAVWEQNLDKGNGLLFSSHFSRDVMDFTAYGNWEFIRLCAKLRPFLNARLQSLDKFYRGGVLPTTRALSGSATKTEKQQAARFGKVAGLIMMTSIALYLINKDDEEYQNLPDETKDGFLFLRAGDHAFLAPQPFELGSVGAMSARLLEQFADDKVTGELFLHRLKVVMTQTFGFDITPQAVAPIFDVWRNEDTFTGQPIENARMQKMAPEMRFNENTSRTAKGISSVVGGAVSPVQVDKLITGYFSAVGGWATGMIDAMVEAFDDKKSATKHFYEYQPIKRFYKNLSDPASSNRDTAVFYDALNETERAAVTVKELQNIGRDEEAMEFAKENRDKLGEYKVLAKLQAKLTKINKAQKDIKNRDDLDGDQKRRELDRLQVIENHLTALANKKIVTPAKLKEANK